MGPYAAPAVSSAFLHAWRDGADAASAIAEIPKRASTLERSAPVRATTSPMIPMASAAAIRITK